MGISTIILEGTCVLCINGWCISVDLQKLFLISVLLHKELLKAFHIVFYLAMINVDNGRFVL